ncbi:DoxX family protein [Undibacterium rugosum]|uniref:DoxX family protein n=1 Tax=Undibacterium rugosum TaxID=2762291 RepID=A0A923KYN2_9BURK|nr:DoxX family protein [Undibacterium rugosum]MBC3934578.1 DoxX family protein [Undibacterium rugosum]MBR7777192.1 DoxX family protein [Undibacterium rugosum]
MNIIQFAAGLEYEIGNRMQRWVQPLALLALRCFVAWQFLKAGLLKVQDWALTLSLFREEYQVPLLPPELAALLGSGGELILPLFLIAGLFCRPAACGLLMVNLMAVISYPVLWTFDCPAAIRDHFYWGGILLLLVVVGAGRLSMDVYFKSLTSRSN